MASQHPLIRGSNLCKLSHSCARPFRYLKRWFKAECSSTKRSIKPFSGDQNDEQSHRIANTRPSPVRTITLSTIHSVSVPSGDAASIDIDILRATDHRRYSRNGYGCKWGGRTERKH